MKYSEAPNVSVVTPFHNTADYLEQCIKSVIDQTYSDFEYILVDNQSTDGASDIAKKYAKRDPRIKLFHTDQLLSQVQNYNYALSKISTKSNWCKIVQADDWIAPECLEKSVLVGMSSPKIGIVSSYILKGLEVKGEGLPFGSSVVNGKQICRMQLIEGRFFFGSPTALLYRASIVRSRDQFFEEGHLHEDTEICYEILKTWDFGFVHQILAFLRTDNNGISSRFDDYNPHLLDKYIVLKRFGTNFLTDSEFRKLMANTKKLYEQYIGEAVLCRRNSHFWEYHRNGLESAGEKCNWNRMAKAVIIALNYHLCHPCETIKRVWRKIL